MRERERVREREGERVK